MFKNLSIIEMWSNTYICVELIIHAHESDGACNGFCLELQCSMYSYMNHLSLGFILFYVLISLFFRLFISGLKQSESVATFSCLYYHSLYETFQSRPVYHYYEAKTAHLKHYILHFGNHSMSDEENAKRDRTVAKGLFTRACNNLRGSINEDADVEITESRFCRVQREYSNTQERHEVYMSFLNDDAYEAGDVWMTDIDMTFDSVERAKVDYSKVKKREVKHEDTEVQIEQQRTHLILKAEEAVFNHLIDNCTKVIYEQTAATDPLIEVV